MRGFGPSLLTLSTALPRVGVFDRMAHMRRALNALTGLWLISVTGGLWLENWASTHSIPSENILICVKTKRRLIRLPRRKDFLSNVGLSQFRERLLNIFSAGMRERGVNYPCGKGVHATLKKHTWCWSLCPAPCAPGTSMYHATRRQAERAHRETKTLSVAAL